MECDYDVGTAKEISQFSYYEVIISKRDPCSGGGDDGCKWPVFYR